MSGSSASPESTSLEDPFLKLSHSWLQNSTRQLLDFVWQGYDDMRKTPPLIDSKDLERSISQLLEVRIRDAMSGDEPFYVQHGPYERETMKAPPAQPPQYDLAFVLRADERMMWPIEAKVLETPNQIASYVSDLKEEFLTCRYAPFSGAGAMLGYLLSGTVEQAFRAIAGRLDCPLEQVVEYGIRPCRRSRHQRTVPEGKPYPREFDCHHLMLQYPDVERARHAELDRRTSPAAANRES